MKMAEDGLLGNETAQMISRHVASLLLGGETEIYHKVVGAAETAIIDAVLKHCDGDAAEAARRLGMTSATLEAKLNGQWHD